MIFFPLGILNLMSRENCNVVMLVNLIFMIFLPFFKSRVEYPFKEMQY